jgi:ribosome biogenesis GTPase A
VSESPPVYLIDSPGILLPKLGQSEVEKGLRLALTGNTRGRNC